MKQKWLERKDSLYSRCFHVVFTKGRESHKPGVPPVPLWWWYQDAPPIHCRRCAGERGL